MGTLRAKLAAGLVLAGGLGAGVGGWAVQAQPPVKAVAAKPTPAGKWEYFYLPLDKSDSIDRDEFERAVAVNEAAGWAYLGTMPAPVWGRRTQLVFRRPATAGATPFTAEQATLLAAYGAAAEAATPARPADDVAALKARIAQMEAEQAKSLAREQAVRLALQKKLAEAMGEHAQATKQLEQLLAPGGRPVKASPNATPPTVLKLPADLLPLPDVRKSAHLIVALAATRSAAAVTVGERDGGVEVTTDPDTAAWLERVLKALKAGAK